MLVAVLEIVAEFVLEAIFAFSRDARPGTNTIALRPSERSDL